MKLAHSLKLSNKIKDLTELQNSKKINTIHFYIISLIGCFGLNINYAANLN